MRILYVMQYFITAYLAVADMEFRLLQLASKRYEKTEPIKYFEYAAASLPEVVSDLAVLRALVEKNGNGIIMNPTDVACISSAILRILPNERESSAMGRNGHRAIAQEYNWDIIFGRLLQLDEDVAIS